MLIIIILFSAFKLHNSVLYFVQFLKQDSIYSYYLELLLQWCNNRLDRLIIKTV